MKKIALLGALALSLLSPLTMAQEAKALRIGIEAVSYTHLTLPTIYSV